MSAVFQPGAHVLLFLALLLVAILAACSGEQDSAPIRLESVVLDEGSCRNYVLRVSYKGAEGHNSHLVEQCAVGADTVYSSSYWGSGGIFFWRDQVCNASALGWVEAENLCRYDIVVTSNDGALVSRRETFEIKCQ